MTEVIWLAAVLGSLVGMILGASAGAALCASCELEAIFWALAGSVVGGVVLGVAAGLVAGRFGHGLTGPVWWVFLLVIAAALLAEGFLSLFGVFFGGDIPWMLLVSAGSVLPIVIGILVAVKPHRSGPSR